jgi:hypothetical protein
MRDTINACNVSAGKREFKIPFGSIKLRWEDIIKMVLKDVGFGDVDWLHLLQVMASCGHSSEASGFITVREFLDEFSDC